MFRMYATKSDGERIYLFTWMHDAKSGVARAKADSDQFSFEGLHSFEAVPCE